MSAVTDKRIFERAAEAAGGGAALTGYHRDNEALVAARFRLDNGLTIVLMPDHRAPVFAYQSWFRVGSRHEDPNLTGLAHLLEHMMFKGTQQHDIGQFDREMELRGAETNAATWVDWTYYTEALAARSDNLKTVIDFEADRMGGLRLDDECFRSELEVVKNERRMTVDDSIAGRASEALYALSFERHPYRWPTIGTMAHLERVTRTDLEQFYKTYYSPNNATIVVAGAIDPAETLKLLVEHYAALIPQALPARSELSEPAQVATRLKQIEQNVVAPQLCLGYRAPAQRHPDTPALEMLGEVLVVGDNARLHHRLITKERVASDLSGYLTPFAEPGLYELAITLRDGVDPVRVIDMVQQELDRLSGDGVTAAELDKARNGLELAHIEGLQQAESCAEALGHHETNDSDFSLAFRGSELWANVEDSALRRVAADVFCAAHRSGVLVTSPGHSS